MNIQIYMTLFIALAGLVLWALCSDAKMKAVLAKLGEVMLWAGLFAFCFALATKVLHF